MTASSGGLPVLAHKPLRHSRWNATFWTHTYCLHKKKTAGSVFSRLCEVHPVLIKQTSALGFAITGGLHPILQDQTEQVVEQPPVQAGDHQVVEWEAQDAVLAWQAYCWAYPSCYTNMYAISVWRGRMFQQTHLSAADHPACATLKRGWCGDSALLR